MVLIKSPKAIYLAHHDGYCNIQELQQADIYFIYKCLFQHFPL